MTLKILSNNDFKIICRFNIRPTNEPLKINIRFNSLKAPVVLKYKSIIKSDDFAFNAEVRTSSDAFHSTIPIINDLEL